MPAASSRMRLRDFGLALINSAICPWRTKAGECAPVEASANNICTSRARTSLELTLKALPASRVIRRTISSVSRSLKPAGAKRSELSMVIDTSAKLRAGREAAPAKITSSMPPPRIAVGRFSPITQRSASNRLDLPQPFGPTTPVSPSAMIKSVGSTKLLKPFSLSLENRKSSVTSDSVGGKFAGAPPYESTKNHTIWPFGPTYPQDIAKIRPYWAIRLAAKSCCHVANPLDPDLSLPANRTGKVPRTGVKSLGDETGNVVMVTQSGAKCHSRPRDCKRGVHANIHWGSPGRRQRILIREPGDRPYMNETQPVGDDRIRR